MTNDLKNFLEVEIGGILTVGDRILINKVLDLLEKEVRTLNTPPYPVENEKLSMLQDGAIIGFNDCRKELSTIINNLRA